MHKRQYFWQYNKKFIVVCQRIIILFVADQGLVHKVRLKTLKPKAAATSIFVDKCNNRPPSPSKYSEPPSLQS